MSEQSHQARRVLHVVRRFSPLVGGTERYVLELARVQREAGHSVVVLTLDRDILEGSPETLPGHAEIDGISIVRLSGYGNRRWAGTWRPDRVVSWVRRADVVHVHDLRFLFGMILTLAALRRSPVIVHTHGLIFHTPWAAALKRGLVRGYFGPLLRMGRARVIADSEPDRDLLLGLAPYLRYRTHLLPDAIDLRPFTSLQRSPVPGRVLTHGRVAPSKGIDRLIRALALIDHQDWSLRIVGPAEREEPNRLMALAASLEVAHRVEFGGVFPEGGQARELAAAQVAVYPSRGEGFGIALLEAMAAAVPVVVSDIPAHRVLLGDGLTDRVVDFDDPRRAARVLEQALDPSTDLRQTVARERERSREFSIDRLSSQIEDLYRQLLPPRD